MLDVDADLRPDLLAAFEEASDPKVVRRSLVGLAYLDGVDVATISDRYGIPEATCYTWLDRFDRLPVDEALRDSRPPGRPPKLDGEQRSELREDLRSPPTDFGYDDHEWTSPLVRDHVESKYGVAYSTGHVRRLLSELTGD